VLLCCKALLKATEQKAHLLRCSACSAAFGSVLQALLFFRLSAVPIGKVGSISAILPDILKLCRSFLPDVFRRYTFRAEKLLCKKV